MMNLNDEMFVSVRCQKSCLTEKIDDAAHSTVRERKIIMRCKNSVDACNNIFCDLTFVHDATFKNLARSTAIPSRYHLTGHTVTKKNNPNSRKRGKIHRVRRSRPFINSRSRREIVASSAGVFRSPLRIIAFRTFGKRVAAVNRQKNGSKHPPRDKIRVSLHLYAAKNRESLERAARIE